MTDQPTLTIDVGSATGAASSTAPSRGLLVLFSEGELVGTAAYPGMTDTTVGRAADQQVYVQDPSMSRQHARFRFEDDAVSVSDLGSHNGTWVGGIRIQNTVPIASGDIVRCGNTLLAVIDDLVAYSDWPNSALAEPLLGGPQIATVRSTVDRIASRATDILISGESGTGKEVVARLIHQASRRSGGFVAVNCAAIPESLFESELFGSEQGAFTGSTERKPGLIKQADRGTLFLDEIGELPMSLQGKLLRFTELKEVRSIGSGQPTAVDVRVVAATNRDLTDAIRCGTFRRDLYHRVSAITIELAPLRQRREDIAVLCEFFARRCTPACNLTADVVEKLLLYHWPGNVRELRHVITEASLKAEIAGSTTLSPQLLRLEGAAVEPAGAGDGQLQTVCDALRRVDGNVAAASTALGLSRRRIYALLRSHGITAKDFRRPR